ncbi:MtrB/PioB family decaheme-associated outer membrane protein [Proteobacteria bacterium 005FR1]|nr:MtrB/PioB family decaheme-associated outer membrane protein [Proteobacteria bacterium 005FR1]
MKPAYLIAAAVIALVNTAHANDRRETEAEAEMGSGYLSDDSFRFGRYTGLVDEGFELWLDFSASSTPAWNSEERQYWFVRGDDLGLDTIFFEGEIGRFGDQSLTLRYREIPHYFFDDGATPFRLVDENFWVLPGEWQVSGDTTSSFINLNAFLTPVEIKHERERLDLIWEKQLPANWDFEADYRHERKEGWRTVGAVIGSNGGNARSAILPASIDFQTDVVDLGLNYSGERSSFGIGYLGSFFHSDDNQLRWQNPYGAEEDWAVGVAYPLGAGRLSLEPDNSSHRVTLAGSHAFSSDTRGSFELGYGQMLQDDDFLPYTINDALAVPFALTRDSLEGKIETISADLRLTTRPLKEIYLVTRYRLDDRDNQTPRSVFLPVPGDSIDQVPVEEAELNRPYSYRKQTAALDAHYRASRRVRVEAGYEVSEIERSYSEVEQTREYIANLGTTLSTFDDLSLHLSYAYSERRGERYIGNRPLRAAHLPGTVAEEDFENHPLLRKYYLADRHRDRLLFRADWFASEKLSVGLSTAYHKDDYTDEFFGLNEVALHSYTLDASYLIRENFHVSGFIGLDRYEQDQSGRSFTPIVPGQVDDPERNWQVNAADRFTTMHIAAEHEALQERFPILNQWGLNGDLDAGLEFGTSQSTGDVDLSTGPALANAPLPEIETDLRYYKLFADYAVSENSYLGLSLTHEQYDNDDFRIDRVDPATMDWVLSLGQDTFDYSVNWIELSFRRRF